MVGGCQGTSACCGDNALRLRTEKMECVENIIVYD